MLCISSITNIEHFLCQEVKFNLFMDIYVEYVNIYCRKIIKLLNYLSETILITYSYEAERNSY